FSLTTGSNKQVSINHGTYERVVDHLRTGHVAVDGNPTNLPSGVAAQCTSNAGPRNGNTLRVSVPRVSGRFFESVVVHEATHSSFDLVQTSGLPAWEEEAVCFVAQFMYLRGAGLPAERMPTYPGITPAALAIVDAINRDPDRGASSAQIRVLEAA